MENILENEIKLENNLVNEKEQNNFFHCIFPLIIINLSN